MGRMPKYCIELRIETSLSVGRSVRFLQFMKYILNRLDSFVVKPNCNVVLKMKNYIGVGYYTEISKSGNTHLVD